MKLFFNHIAKAGGDSLHQAMRRALGDDYVDLNNEEMGQILPATKAEAIHPYTRSTSIVAMGAHVNLPSPEIAKEILDRCLSISIVRHPVARLESYYLFVRQNPHLNDHQLAMSMGPDEFVEWMLGNAHSMVYPWQRAQLLYENNLYRVGVRPHVETLDHMKQNLYRNYLLVGTTESMGAFYAALADILRTVTGRDDLDLREERTNTRREGEEVVFSPEMIAKIEECTAPDVTRHQWLESEGPFVNRHLHRFDGRSGPASGRSLDLNRALFFLGDALARQCRGSTVRAI